MATTVFAGGAVCVLLVREESLHGPLISQATIAIRNKVPVECFKFVPLIHERTIPRHRHHFKSKPPSLDRVVCTLYRFVGDPI